MGKKSKYPEYSAGSVNINGRTVATAKKDDNGTISTSYNMTKSEKNLYNNVQKNLTNSLKNLYNFSNVQDNWNKQLDAYKRNGIQQIDDIYTPMERSLKNDIAGRFGNLDNSIFLDKLTDITDNKAKAVSSLSDSLLMKQDELYSNELTNRMNYLSLLSGINTNMTNQMLSYINLAKSNAESGNNYSSNSYQANASNGSFLGNALGSAASYGNLLNFVYPGVGTAVSTASRIAANFV